MLPIHTLTLKSADVADALEGKADEAIKEANKFLDTVEGYLPKVLDFGIKLLIAVVILIAGRIVIGFLMKFLKKFFDRTKIEISVKKFMLSLCKALLYLMLIIIVCNQVGIDTTSFIAILGSAGLAVGLAMQGSLSNFAGGVLILLVKPFVVGDYIVDESTGKEGSVSKIDLFYTHLATVDNKTVIIPNGSLANAAVTNVTAQKKRRVDIEFGISYNASMKEAKRVAEQVIDRENRVLREEGISVFIKELAASQVTVGIRVWTKTEDYWDVYFALTENIKEAMDEAGIEIPFNQLEVHINKGDKE